MLFNKLKDNNYFDCIVIESQHYYMATHIIEFTSYG